MCVMILVWPKQGVDLAIMEEVHCNYVHTDTKHYNLYTLHIRSTYCIVLLCTIHTWYIHTMMWLELELTPYHHFNVIMMLWYVRISMHCPISNKVQLVLSLNWGTYWIHTSYITENTTILIFYKLRYSVAYRWLTGGCEVINRVVNT